MDLICNDEQILNITKKVYTILYTMEQLTNYVVINI